MTTLTELRDRVRAQTQTTSGDIGDSLIDWWLQQGYERTINAEVRWPFFEQSWAVMLPAGQYQVVLPGDANPPGIMTLFDLDRGVRLVQVPQQWAEESFPGRPTFDGVQWAIQTPVSPQVWYSVWSDKITFWPIAVSATDRSFNLRGYRRPTNWLTAAQEPDCDQRLHLPLIHYAVALAYEQQEDETLNGVYMDRWQRDVEMAHSQIMEPRHQRPLLGGGTIDRGPVPIQPFVVVPPS